ncbi:hypothetical protein BDP67DRAFT_111865 [Colletotrichum lupini]|nr:hypothetical protein BDP67DRAFT_111865 [Colletotrichum lupini]
MQHYCVAPISSLLFLVTVFKQRSLAIPGQRLRCSRDLRSKETLVRVRMLTSGDCLAMIQCDSVICLLSHRPRFKTQIHFRAGQRVPDLCFPSYTAGF